MVEQRTENPRVEGSSPPPTTIYLMKFTSNDIAQTSLIAAIYAAATLCCNLALPGLSWGPIQLRISEAICVCALFTKAAIPGLSAGCLIANLINICISGSGMLGLLDVFFGTFATFICALMCWKFREKENLALSFFIITNAIIVPAYLPIILQFSGFYTIPFTSISLDGMWGWMYLFGLFSISISESLTIFVIGKPIASGLKRTKVF